MHVLLPSILLASSRGGQLLNLSGEIIDELVDMDLPDTTCSIRDIPNLRLTRCKFFKVESKGELFLNECRVEKVVAVKKATLINQCEIGEVMTDEDGEVWIEKCKNVKAVATGRVILDQVFPSMKLHVKILIRTADFSVYTEGS